MSTVIYYFTGSGNSLKIAKDIQNQLGDTKLVRICQENMENRDASDADRIGFVFPVHGRGLPQMVKQFVENLHVGQGKYVFAVANFGDYAALTFIQLNNLLAGKGLQLSAGFGVPMPGNKWFMYYPHPKQEFIDRIKAQPDITLRIAERIQRKDMVPFQAAVAKQQIEEEWYHNFSPNIDKDFWANQKCTGCGICAQICPTDDIKMIDNKPVWQKRCVSCLACLHWCPEAAIEYKQDSLDRERYHHPDISVEELFRTEHGK